MERLTFKNEEGKMTASAHDWQKVVEKLAKYEDAEEQERLLISDYKIGDKMYAIVHDDIYDTYDISEHCITDVCIPSAIITDAPLGDDRADVWTMEMLKEYHVSFSMEEAEKIKAELEANDGTTDIL